MAKITLHLFRHAKVDSHRGDVPLAPDADQAIQDAASWLIPQLQTGDRIAFFATQTRRSKDTAERLRLLLQGSDLPLTLDDIRQEYAIRNPDLYLAGHRVEMVSTGEAMAGQLPADLMTAENVEKTPFFGAFFNARDRIQYWLEHSDPPGEDARAVARRIMKFCLSLGDADTSQDLRIVAVSHSPVMRAVLVQFMKLDDPGEPGWVEPITVSMTAAGGTITFRGSTNSLTI